MVWSWFVHIYFCPLTNQCTVQSLVSTEQLYHFLHLWLNLKVTECLLSGGVFREAHGIQFHINFMHFYVTHRIYSEKSWVTYWSVQLVQHNTKNVCFFWAIFAFNNRINKKMCEVAQNQAMTTGIRTMVSVNGAWFANRQPQKFD